MYNVSPEFIDQVLERHKARILSGAFKNPYNEVPCTFKCVEGDFLDFKDRLKDIAPSFHETLHSPSSEHRGLGAKTIARALSTKQKKAPPQASRSFLTFVGYYLFEYEWDKIKDGFWHAVDKNENAAIGTISRNFQTAGTDQNRRKNNSVPSFPTGGSPSTFSGLWLSRFSYNSKRSSGFVRKFQYNIEKLTYASDGNLIGVNILSSTPAGFWFKHELKLQLLDNYIVGIWLNSNTKNLGTFQLYVHTNPSIMSGMHLGNANDNTIQSGEWIWIRVNGENEYCVEEDQVEINSEMIPLDELNRSFDEWVNNAEPLSLNQILKH